MSTRTGVILLAIANLFPWGRTHAAADLNITLMPNGPSYIAPGSRRDMEIVVRNSGPDRVEEVAVVTAEYLVFPIGEVTIDPPVTGPSCPLQYTDFMTPGGQRLELAFFVAPSLGAGEVYRCRISVFAIGRGTTSYDVRMQVTGLDKGHTEINPANNRVTFPLSFVLVTQIPVLSIPGLLLLMLAFSAAAWRNQR